MPYPPRARNTTMRHAGVLLLLLLLALPAAGAHAVLERADPPASGHADEGVSRITIRFTEGVEREYTDADVVDTEGVSWKEGPIEFDAAQSNVIHVTVRPLVSGLYSVSWKALSVDTHTTRGTYVFAVGDATLLPGQYDPVVEAEDAGAVYRDGFARFAFFVGLFLAAGMPLFALVVIRDAPQSVADRSWPAGPDGIRDAPQSVADRSWPGGHDGIRGAPQSVADRSWPGGHDGIRGAPPRALFLTAAAFGIVGVAGAFVMLLFLGERLDADLGSALETSPGRSILTRGAFLLGATVAVAVAAARPGAWRAASIAALLLGAASIVATSTGSHAAALRENAALYIAADAVHLVAATVWIGGIVAFLHALPGRDPHETSQMVFRFGGLAVPSVLLLLATGTLASLVHMPCSREGAAACADALGESRYMQLVAVKLLLMAPLIALGAVNKFSIGPRLARGAWSPLAFRRIVQAEAVLMAIIVGAAGVLAASSPPETDAQTGTPGIAPIFEVANFTAKSHVILQVSPNPVTVGVQRVVVVVHPLTPTLPNGTLVALKIWHASEGEPEDTINPAKVTPNEWEIEDGLFTSAGTWNVLIIVQRSDEYAKVTFQVPVVNPGSQPPTGS